MSVDHQSEWGDGMPPLRVGLIGCGYISDVYLQNCRALPNLEVLACADAVLDRARERAGRFGVRACTVQELLADGAIEVVLNLTVPLAHAEITLAALEAGKHVYTEKPLAITREDGRRILEVATARGLLVGCAPDTFLGAGGQTCRSLIDDGAIGRPVAATSFFMTRGNEMWHPNPDFFYQVGGGPLLDMAPYSLTALINFLGPIRQVCGFSRITFPERTVTSQPHAGMTITVRTPTHVAAILDFHSGAVATLLSSWDVWAHSLPDMELYGSEGSLWVPDPNFFHGNARLRRAGWDRWHEVTSSSPYSENWRGIGLADMACAIRRGGSFRATGELAYHVLDVMHAILESAQAGRHVTVESTCARPDPLPSPLALPSRDEVGRDDVWLTLRTSA